MQLQTMPLKFRVWDKEEKELIAGGLAAIIIGLYIVLCYRIATGKH